MKKASVRRAAFLIPAVAFGVIVAAQEKPVKPPKEFQDLMKSNTRIVAVDGPLGPLGPEAGGGPGGPTRTPLAGSITEHLGNEDYDAIFKDAATLKANFAKIEAFFTEQTFGDALELAKAGAQAAGDIQRFAADGVWQIGDPIAMARNKLEIQRAQLALAQACRNCHIEHRVYVLTVPVEFHIR